MSNTTHVVEHIKSAENIIKQSLHKKAFESGIKTTVNAFIKVDKLCLKYMFEFEF